jgi:hypothetical protein
MASNSEALLAFVPAGRREDGDDAPDQFCEYEMVIGRPTVTRPIQRPGQGDPSGGPPRKGYRWNSFMRSAVTIRRLAPYMSEEKTKVVSQKSSFNTHSKAAP